MVNQDFIKTQNEVDIQMLGVNFYLREGNQNSLVLKVEEIYERR